MSHIHSIRLNRRVAVLHEIQFDTLTAFSPDRPALRRHPYRLVPGDLQDDVRDGVVSADATTVLKRRKV